MSSKKNIFIAFLLNFFFSVFEFFGGIFTGSVAIISDAVHDLGDASSIGIAYFLEKKSAKQPDATHTYGYKRYSVLGSVITTCILLVGSVLVVYNAILRLISPVAIRYNGMMIFAVVGVIVNLLASFVTREGKSLNQKAVNLHMLEDVLGWAVVLIGAVVMRFTNWVWIDPVMSIGVAIFIFIHAVLSLKEALDLFLVKTPKGLTVDDLKAHIMHVEGVKDAHHIHVWSLDGNDRYATAHLVVEGDFALVKERVREHLHEHGVTHVTLELETVGEVCHDEHCHVEMEEHGGCHHHHHHHHNHHH
ncbi:MAG: cation transporter [Clostridia bacterium]|nr:cation transporter [Clostridia bacterium]